MTNSTRSNIIELLKLISSTPAQLEYKKNVPIADVRAELICMWFDDLYHPETEWFQSAFQPNECAVLKEFNDFYEAQLKKLPKTFDELSKSSAWQAVQAKASQALAGMS